MARSTFGAGVDSGTFDYFTEAIVGKAKSSRGDYTSSEDDNVLVQGISGDELALGCFGLAYYEENQAKLRALPVDAGDGRGPIAPSKDTVRTNDYRPLSRPLFVYVARSAFDRPEVKAFVDYYLTNATRLVSEVGYVPSPEQMPALVDTSATGSIWGRCSPTIGRSPARVCSRACSARCRSSRLGTICHQSRS
ncbi:MAG: substrate-binding domain-containing protein [Vicinamibacterales bacterium]